MVALEFSCVTGRNLKVGSWSFGEIENLLFEILTFRKNTLVPSLDELYTVESENEFTSLTSV